VLDRVLYQLRHVDLAPGTYNRDAGIGIDHPSIVFGELLAEARRRLGFHIPQLVRRASLNLAEPRIEVSGK
jgi:hypothetical protein